MNDQQGLTNGCLASLEEEDYKIEWPEIDDNEIDNVFEDFINHIKTISNEK